MTFCLLPLPGATAEVTLPPEPHLITYGFIEHLLAGCKGRQTENTVCFHWGGR